MHKPGFFYFPLSALCVLLLFSCPVMAAGSYDRETSDAVVYLLKELKSEHLLQNHKIAVYGFRDAKSGKGCSPLSGALADRISGRVLDLKNFSDLGYEVVARRNLESVETEYLLSGGSLDSGVRGLLAPSDILITGSWTNGQGSFSLNVQALQIQPHGTRLLASRTVEIDKLTLPPGLDSCLKWQGSSNSGDEPTGQVQTLQEQINKYNRQIAELAKRKRSQQLARDMQRILSEKRKTVKTLLSHNDNGVAYTTRNYSENLAWLNIDTNPSGQEIYIDDKMVGLAPLKRYEIEAGKEHTITAKGDPRYLLPASISRSFDQFSRKNIQLNLDKGSGKLLLLADEIFDTVLVDGRKVDFDPDKPLITLEAGKHKVQVWKTKDNNLQTATFNHDAWNNDLVRYDLGELKPLVCPKDTAGHQPPFTEPTTGMEFIYVPGGGFFMACDPLTGDCHEFKLQPPLVCLSGFYLAKTEVTQGQWNRLMDTNPSHFKKGDNYPVEEVNWFEAAAFANRLSASNGYEECYTLSGCKNQPGNDMECSEVTIKNKCTGFRLPTEAQWEYGCRSGGKEEKYCGGNDLDSLAWYDDNSGGSTHPVATTPKANHLGLYDMSGNVWEWCQDWYGDYQDQPVVINPIGPESGRSRVYRGGSWYDDARYLRSANRNLNSPGSRDFYFGFRLVRTP